MTIIRQKKYIFKQQLSAEHGMRTVLRFLFTVYCFFAIMGTRKQNNTAILCKEGDVTKILIRQKLIKRIKSNFNSIKRVKNELKSS